ncbi:MAG: hydroxymethylbilane synthase [Armatimonadota bacterium]
MVEIAVGTRGSVLALTQANWVADEIKRNNPEVRTRIEIIRTTGDKILDTPLSKIGDKGLFVKEIEAALADGRIDAAVHSMKDLPSDMAEGLAIGAVPPRVDPSDVLLSNKGRLFDLPPGAKIGSSSLRRKAQILHVRPDLTIEDLRGNLDTRIRRLESGDYDAIILAYAGLYRLKWDGNIAERLPHEICLPAAGQGALAVEIRKNDPRTAGIVGKLDDQGTRAAVTAERALLSLLGGGCQVPIAALAVENEGNLTLNALVASLDGSEIVRAEENGNIADAAALGERTANLLLDKGAKDILSKVRQDLSPTGMGAA